MRAEAIESEAIESEAIEAIAAIESGSVSQSGGAIGAIDLAPTTPTASKKALRTSLRASTVDGVFATIFSNGAGGVLLSNFLVELHASPTEIGLLSSIPMLANLIQPIGAILSERSRSRHNYSLWIYGPSRLLWLVLVGGIALSHWHTADPQVLIRGTLAIVCVTHFIGALGSASWLSWLAVLVPRRLRGRYFGIRNSAASLTSLLCVPLLGWMVSAFPAGSIEGYGLVLLLAIVAGVISIGFQFFMVDVNPQTQAQVEEGKAVPQPEVNSPTNSSTNSPTNSTNSPANSPASLQVNLEAGTATPSVPALHDRNFLVFLLYLTLWTFAVNLSAPFFNLYLLDNLAIDLQAVTIYNSLQSGANLLLLMFWGQLADRVGNRAVLLGVGILVAATPLLWLGTSADSASVWLWFPLLHILGGGTWAAIDLCNNNLQLGVAPLKHQTHYFAIAAAVAGVSGALGTTTGGLLVEFADYGGIPGLFALSAIVRLGALLPLLLVHEQRGQSLRMLMRMLFPGKG